jgi:hypothetical protein
MNDVWIRLRVGWSPQGGATALGWAQWQPKHIAAPWPAEEMRPSFTYYACEELKGGGRAIVARATVVGVLRPTVVESAEIAHKVIADQLFDDQLTIDYEAWSTNAYNRVKASAPWPQRVTAWRVVTEPVGPHFLPELLRFPHSGWLRSARIGL